MHGPDSSVETIYAPDGTPISTPKVGGDTTLAVSDVSAQASVTVFLGAILQELRVMNTILQATLGYNGELDALRCCTSRDP